MFVCNEGEAMKDEGLTEIGEGASAGRQLGLGVADAGGCVQLCKEQLCLVHSAVLDRNGSLPKGLVVLMFVCNECGYRFESTAAALEAICEGCRNCGGFDIDVEGSLPTGFRPYVAPLAKSQPNWVKEKR